MKYTSNPLVDTYIAQFNEATQKRLIWLRAAVQATFPTTIEDISYGIPTYRPEPGKRGIIHFGATKGHIGIYGVFEPKTDAYIHDIMKPHRSGRGTLQFKNDEPLPKHVIREILAFHAGKI
ncbi:MAG: DUF1801 domain-containing protein [Candidatus Microsaccharimonas sp.]